VHPSEIPFTAARHAVLAAIPYGAASYAALASAISRCRTVIARNRHSARKIKACPGFPGAGGDTGTRIAQAVITVWNTPA